MSFETVFMLLCHILNSSQAAGVDGKEAGQPHVKQPTLSVTLSSVTPTSSYLSSEMPRLHPYHRPLTEETSRSDELCAAPA